MSFVKGIPDIIEEKSNSKQPIDLVGIRDLKMPVRLTPSQTVSSNISIFVSLDDKEARGIHMSRLYSNVHDYLSHHVVKFSGLKQVLIKAIKSQKGISQSGYMRIESSWTVLRKALKSSLSGWKEYPFYIELSYSKKRKSFEYSVGAEVLYSSTCPCSASLSCSIIKKDFEKHFSKHKTFTKQEVLKYLSDPKFLSATPHAQKSQAFFKLKLSERAKDSFSLLKTVDAVEKSLGTPVQTAVKREDEAEFARLNAKNLMFCEDAIRYITLLFKNKKTILDYIIRVQHYESLHPFTVESNVVKGVKGGWRV